VCLLLAQCVEAVIAKTALPEFETNAEVPEELEKKLTMKRYCAILL
jgi:hypothetical protein